MSVTRTLQLLKAALGPELALRELRKDGELIAAIGRWRHEGADVIFPDSGTVQLVLNISGGQQIEWRSDVHSFKAAPRAGDLALAAADSPARVRISGRADTVQIILSHKMIERAWAASHPPATSPTEGDRRLKAAGLAAFLALSQGEAIGAPIAALVADVACELAARARPGLARRSGGLTPAKLRRVQTLMTRPDISSPISELAEAAGLSQFHFIRAFRATVGETPHAWLNAARIDGVLSQILGGDVQVADVAEAFGFSSPSHCISAFRKRLGVTPGAIALAAAS